MLFFNHNYNIVCVSFSAHHAIKSYWETKIIDEFCSLKKRLNLALSCYYIVITLLQPFSWNSCFPIKQKYSIIYLTSGKLKVAVFCLEVKLNITLMKNMAKGEEMDDVVEVPRTQPCGTPKESGAGITLLLLSVFCIGSL